MMAWFPKRNHRQLKKKCAAPPRRPSGGGGRRRRHGRYLAEDKVNKAKVDEALKPCNRIPVDPGAPPPAVDGVSGPAEQS